MFDVYQPIPGLACPICARRLRIWQGKEGPRLCLVFRQGVFDAIGTALDGWPVYQKLYGDPIRLRSVFHIYSYDCRRPVPTPPGTKRTGRRSGAEWDGRAAR